jgi:L-ascorbate metabolism protein UlaG (beta-lactamase superfamily)
MLLSALPWRHRVEGDRMTPGPRGTKRPMDTRIELDPVGDDDAGEDWLLFIGNATMLLRYGGFTILTDPTFVHRHEEVSIGYGMTAKRLTDPALEIADLPPLDFVLLSHFHGDHFDQVAERELDRGLQVVTTPQACGDLGDRGFHNTVGIDTWDTVTLTKGDRQLTVTACPGRHGPGVTDLALPDVMGSVLTATDSPSVYISGDTLFYEGLEEIPRRHPDLDVGVLHLGGTKVLGVTVTMDAKQGIEAARLIDPRTIVPVHYDDYDVFTSPLEDFVDAAVLAGMASRVRTVARGDRITLR